MADERNTLTKFKSSSNEKCFYSHYVFDVSGSPIGGAEETMFGATNGHVSQEDHAHYCW